MPNENEPETIEQLRARYEKLSKSRTEAETRLDMAMKQLDRLKAEARERYGTDDLEELRGKLQEMERENLTKRKSYQALLDKIEEELAAIER